MNIQNLALLLNAYLSQYQNLSVKYSVQNIIFYLYDELYNI